MSWTETDSRLYQELAAVAVPDRVEQMATLLTLLPFGPHDAARVVELGCGEGHLSHAVLDAFQNATVLALDGSEEMRATASARLKDFGARARVEPFTLESDAWLPLADGANAVISSLAVHHLDGPAKRQLFEALGARLADDGALLIADLVQPTRAEVTELFAAAWDAAARRQAQTPPGSSRGFEQFIHTQWNIFRYPDPVDMPSPLFEQLAWLRGAGFRMVDCFWLRAGHAVYGGYRSAERPAAAGAPLGFEVALAAAATSLDRPAGGVSI
jgi:tRNA (cmo5U34)-methyltransferase